MKLKLSILEFGNINPPNTYAHDVIENLFDFAESLDDLGFTRLWMSEHYNLEFAWHSPEIFLPLLAASTEKIKIGQAGVLLNYHAPFRVAHNYAMLSALFPGRIDLGLVAAPISDEAMFALTEKNNQPSRIDFSNKFQSLIDLLDGNALNNKEENSLYLPLKGVAKPNVWTMGISNASIPMAVAHKTNFCISLFHVGAKFDNQKEVIRQYKDSYYLKNNEVPKGVATIICNCSDDQKIIKERYNSVSRQVQQKGFVVGRPAECKEQLQELAYELDLDEIVLRVPGSFELKKETSALLSEEMMLKETPEMELAIN